MREANFCIISRGLIFSWGHSSWSFFLSTPYQFPYSGNSLLLFLSPEKIKLKFLNKEIRNKLRLLHFPINNTKTLRNHQSFYDRGVLKKIWKIYSTMGDVFAKMDIEVKFLQSLKHGKILICSQKKCYKKVII